MTHDLPLLPREFSFYPLDTLPDIPADWEDTSWHNDACPSFQTPCGISVWLDWADEAERECAAGGRFILWWRESGEDFFASDDWAATLAAVEKETAAFEAWRATGKAVDLRDHDDMTHCYRDENPEPVMGRIYDQGFISGEGDTWNCIVSTSDTGNVTLPEAERALWSLWTRKLDEAANAK